MTSNELIKLPNNGIQYKNVGVKRIESHSNYLFIVLDNGQKLLIAENKIYDVSNYEHFVDYFYINGKQYAVLRNFFLYLIDLENMNVVFHDKDAHAIFKNDEKTLKVLMNSSGKKIFNIETKEYLPMPDDYEYEGSLGNDLYVFRERDLKKDYYDCKRYIVNVDGKILLKDIEGYVYYSDNKLIIIRRDEISVVRITPDGEFDIKTIQKNETIIAKPLYYDGNIVVVGQKSVKIYNLELVEIKNIKIDNFNEIKDITWNGDVLHLIVSYTLDGEIKQKRIFVSLKTGNVVSHRFLEGYPYWTPTTFIGTDSDDSEIKDYYFYDKDLKLISRIQANTYYGVDNDKECIFLLVKQVDDETQKIVFNSESNVLLAIDYDHIEFSTSIPYGYGINIKKKTIDFFDRDLNVIIPNFEYEKYGINPMLFYKEFSYDIINDYVCIQKHFVGDWGESRYRTIIYKATGEVILDSTKERAIPIGKFFQITSDGNNRFLNTDTGEIGTLIISAPVDEFNQINYAELTDPSSLVRIGTSDAQPPESSTGKYMKRLQLLSNDNSAQ